MDFPPQGRELRLQEQKPILNPCYGTIPQGTEGMLIILDRFHQNGPEIYSHLFISSFLIQNGSTSNQICGVMECDDSMTHYHDIHIRLLLTKDLI